MAGRIYYKILPHAVQTSSSMYFAAGHLKNLKQNHGKIIVLSTSKGNPRMELNFQANVLQG